MIEHKKIIAVALNGPAVGIGAALLGQADFIYAVENAYLLTPFTNLSIPPELASTYMFAQRMGVAKANEALLMSKKIPAQELLSRGFVNKLYPNQPDASFLASVIHELKDRFEGIPHDNLLKTRALIRFPYRHYAELNNVSEVFNGAEQ